MEETKYEIDEYKKMVEQVSPNSHIFKDCTRAFVVGGTICTIGQIINNTMLNYDVSKENAATYTTIILIFFGVVLTGMGIYQRIGKFAGAGSIVPITGFANSVASPTLEFKKEGWIVGVGGKMFIIAGAVVLYGTLSSMLVGAVYYLVNYVIK